MQPNKLKQMTPETLLLFATLNKNTKLPYFPPETQHLHCRDEM